MRKLITLLGGLAATLAIVGLAAAANGSSDQGAYAADSTKQNCLAWERDMRSAAGYDDLGGPAIDRLAADEPYGHILNHWVADNCMRLSYVQVVGAHNSYHIQPRLPLLQFLKLINPQAASFEYTHRPLDQQLGAIGIRQVELDVYADPSGGLFAMPLGALVFPNSPPSLDPIKPDLLSPGPKVLHAQDFDFETTCLTLVSCRLTPFSGRPKAAGFSQGRLDVSA